MTTMAYMFQYANAFNQDPIGWCEVTADLTDAFYYTPCSATSCGVTSRACCPAGTYSADGAVPCATCPTGRFAGRGSMSCSTFSSKSELLAARNAWFADAAAATAIYGHISTWDVSAIKDMSYLFKGKSSFNEDLSSWDARRAASASTIFRTLFL